MKFAVIGHPIEHSLSPIMHHANFEALNLDHGYQALNIPPAHFKHIRDIVAEYELDGFNVTIPHKERIIPYLDELTDEAKAIGAVNTVRIDGEHWVGHNTDGVGYVKGLVDYYGELSDAKILIIGAGGASKGIAYSLSQRTKHPIAVANRTLSRFEDWQFEVTAYPLSEVDHIAYQYDIIINTTPVGMHTSTEQVVTLQQLKDDVLVCDIIYTPAETAFLKTAKMQGYNIYNGLDMFIYQGAESFKFWTGMQADVHVMRNRVKEKLYSD
ncbi:MULTISPECIES: shikimate dehydrogenase [unclassified Staphylococcus]|uniref:shikimate dehydrogenase n=1 Tax=unclassified Staphylococcus TaxID=91994 RepID=UPI0021D0662F|nr:MULTISPECIES: shikimate dehydrogenase [unclassified Staphylococcus]UXR77356.1 shikimate dehydrogenase [Staphylococcus sp. IVB6227]UXR81619.1 shikimate dehydrogenase [Staphylococcus sp. IVB6214]